MSFLKEFKDFALKGSVLDLAVGVIIGAAFGTLVKSMVDDIIMPVVGNFVGKTSFTNLYLNLSGTPYANVEDARKAGAAIIPYGNFLQNVVNFSIIAFCVFLIVKIANSAIRKKAAEPASPVAPEEVLLLREIRDQLKK